MSCLDLYIAGDWLEATFDCFWAAQLGGMAPFVLLVGLPVIVGTYIRTRSIVLPGTLTALLAGVMLAAAPSSVALAAVLFVASALSIGVYNLIN